jgi:uncharacterized surface protein with fasciclin (FAS1) repeats
MKFATRSALTLGVVALVALAVAVPWKAEAAPPGDQTIVEIAVSDPDNFSTLVAAVQQAGLVDALDGNRHYTVFAPTDDAFAAIGLNAGNIDTVPAAELKNILLYHVTNGDRNSQSVIPADSIRMANGERTFPQLTSEGAFIEGANSTAEIVIPDVNASNGVIHVIDTVLLPK